MNPARRFTDDQVRAIRREYRTPCTTCGKFPTTGDLAKKYGTSASTISNVLNGRLSYFWVES